MAYIDPMMAGAAEDFYAFESEEERRRRLAAEAEAAMPTKQTITYDNNTGAAKVKIEGSATNLSAANPATPTVAGPVSPDDLYKRMIQAESGGRQFNAQGGVLTSPKGAMGVGQVMPATAAQPGYGVTNIFDLAQQRGVPVPSRDTAGAQALLGNEQLNREFGQSYFDAMMRRYGGNQPAAVASYNAGPGRVGQNMQANAGQLNVSQLPQETQAYLQQVMPQSQAGAPAPRPVMMAGGTTATDVLPTTTEQAVNQITASQRFLSAQTDPVLLTQLKQDPNLPAGYKNLAARQNFDLQRQEIEEMRERERLLSDERYLAKVASAKPSEQGSWGKAILFGLLGMENSAKNEATKLGVGAKWDSHNIDGKDYLIKTRADGLPMEGIDPTTGKSIPASIYQQVAGGKRELDIPGGTYVNDRTGEVGRVVTDKRTGRSYVQTDDGRKPMTGFRPQASGGTLADMRAKTIQDINLRLQGKTEEEKMAILRPYNEQLTKQGFPPVDPSEVGIRAPQIADRTAPAAVPTGPVAPTAPAAPAATAPAAPVAPSAAPATPAAPAPVARPTGSTLTAQADIAKNAADLLKEEGELIGQIKSGNKVIDILDNNKTNFGSILTGQIPGEQAVGKFLGTKDARNTQKVMEYVDKVTASGAKALGANPTNRDLEFLLANRPNERWEAEDVKAWINSTQDKIKDSIEIAREQVRTGGAYQPPIPATGGTGAKPAGVKGGSGTKEDPYKL
jgi:soluble lytic murein transglycosylase-like protein